MLLLREFFEVNVKVDGRKPETQVYQATEFAVGEHGAVGIPSSVVVKGTYYAKARVVLGYRSLRDGQHTHDTEASSSDADILLRDTPGGELVRVSNCTAWFNMADLTNGKPMVVHPQDIKERGVSVAGKEQHYVCGSQAVEALNGGEGFTITPLSREELVSYPEQAMGPYWLSVTACWSTMDDLFERARTVLRDGSGVRSGSFDVQWSMGELRFWNQVSDTPDADWKHTVVTRVERRFDANFNFQAMTRDVHRSEITYKSKKDFKRIQFVSGIFGLVGVSREAEQGADQVSRFCTGTNLRMCTSNAQFENAPEGVLPEEYWRSMKGHHGTFRLRYDKQEGKRYGTLTVRMVWHELTYKDVEGFEDEYLIV